MTPAIPMTLQAINNSRLSCNFFRWPCETCDLRKQCCLRSTIFMILPMAQSICILKLTLICSMPFVGISLADESTPSVEPPEAVPAITAPVLTLQQVSIAIEQLRSPEFNVRQESMETLKTVNADQIELLAEAVRNDTDNEVARRCVELLELCYSIGDRDSAVVRQASDIER